MIGGKDKIDHKNSDVENIGCIVGRQSNQNKFDNGFQTWKFQPNPLFIYF